MDFKQLRAFLTVVETGNITRAAKMLHVVQPAMSRQIRLLEEDVGTALFKRERYGMALTEAGEALVVYARRALLELDRARAEIAGMDRGVSGLVTLGLLPSTTDVLASRLVTAMQAAYPDIRIRIAMGYAGTLMRWLEAGEIDACLMYGMERATAAEMQALVEETLWVIGPRGCGLSSARPLPLAALAGHKLVLPSAPHGIRTLVDHACAVAKVDLSIGVETNALNVQRRLVLGGHGWTILPPIAVAEDLKNGMLTGAPIGQPEITRTIALALPSGRATSKHVRCAVEVLIESVKAATQCEDWPQAVWLEK